MDHARLAKPNNEAWTNGHAFGYRDAMRVAIEHLEALKAAAENRLTDCGRANADRRAQIRAYKVALNALRKQL